jgi:hypothetical protein
MWNMGQNETSLYFCMKQVLKLVSCKNRGMFQICENWSLGTGVMSGQGDCLKVKNIRL